MTNFHFCQNENFKRSMQDSESFADGYESYTLEQLLIAKENAIDNLKFEVARDLEAMIQQRKKFDVAATIDAKKQEVRDEIQRLYDAYEKACNDIKRQKEEKELNVRVRIDLSFQECQKRHIEELVLIEKEYALEVIRAKNRPVRNQQELFEQAKKFARMNDFEQSIIIREQANKIYDEKMISRRKDIDEKYNGLRRMVIEHQKSDLMLIRKKLLSMLENLQLEHQRELESEKRKFIVQLRNFQQKANQSITLSAKLNSDKRKLAEGMSNTVHELTMQLTGIDLHQSKATTSPKTPKSAKKKHKIPESNTSSQFTPRKADAHIPSGSPQQLVEQTTQLQEEEESHKECLASEGHQSLESGSDMS